MDGWWCLVTKKRNRLLSFFFFFFEVTDYYYGMEDLHDFWGVGNIKKTKKNKVYDGLY